MKRSAGEPERGDRAGAVPEDDGGDADTNAQLRAMRSVWLSMREEDPPDGGLVDLLSAARAKAATMRERPTFWQRVLAVLRRPPALAFATVVVLIGGAVLVIGRDRGVRSSDLAAGSSGVFGERTPTSTAAPGAGAVGGAAPAKTAPAASQEQQRLERLYKQCESAAHRGDCAAVRRMIGELAKTEPGVRARVAKDAAVARCLAE